MIDLDEAFERGYFHDIYVEALGLKVEKEKLQTRVKKLETALSDIANTRCAWQLSQEIVKKALSE